MTIIVHLIVGIQALAELLLVHRTYEKRYFYIDMAIMVVLMVTYSVIITLVAKLTDITIYEFLKLDFRQIIACNIVITMFGINGFNFYHFLLHQRYEMEKEGIITIDGDKKERMIHQGSYSFDVI